jgi:glycosyltransferase involved in cell wall biosynthesis
MRSPLISVIMPTLNSVNDLHRSLGSLIAQSWRSFEVLIIDGGSEDATVSLASQLLKVADLQHRIETVDGSSIYGAINHGIKAASGDWIYVLGSDDMLLNARVFEDLAPLLRQAQPGVWVVHGDVWIEEPGYRYGQKWDLPRFLDRNISHQSAFYRRKPIQALGIEYNESYRIYADWDYNIRLLAHGGYCYVPLPVASYACTGTSSRAVDERFLADKDRNAMRYFGWRAWWLMPPHRFALAWGDRPTAANRAMLLANRLVWLMRRQWQKLAARS